MIRQLIWYVCLIVINLSFVSFLSAMDTEFKDLNATMAKQKAKFYLDQADKLSRNLGVTLTAIPVDFSGNPTQIKLLGSKWKAEYERLQKIEEARSSGSVAVTSSFIAPKVGVMNPNVLLTEPVASPSVVIDHADPIKSIPSLVDPVGG